MRIYGIMCILVVDNPYKCHISPCGLSPLCCSSIFTVLVVLDLSVQCKFHHQALCKAASVHPTWAKFLQQAGIYMPFQTTIPLSKCLVVSSINTFFVLFFSSQPLRLIPVSCRNFFRRLQPMSSELTPMVSKMRAFLVPSVLSC